MKNKRMSSGHKIGTSQVPPNQFLSKISAVYINIYMLSVQKRVNVWLKCIYNYKFYPFPG